jgi:hypothetical protein
MKEWSSMNALAQQTEFLSWKIVPARLDALQAAWFLGFEPHEIPILIAGGLLKPLGHPARNATKFFATQALEQLRSDEKWLARASDAICQYWRERNARNRSYKREANGRNRFNRQTDRNGRAGSPMNATATG